MLWIIPIQYESRGHHTLFHLNQPLSSPTVCISATHTATMTYVASMPKGRSFKGVARLRISLDRGLCVLGWSAHFLLPLTRPWTHCPTFFRADVLSIVHTTLDRCSDFLIQRMLLGTYRV